MASGRRLIENEVLVATRELCHGNDARVHEVATGSLLIQSLPISRASI